MFVSLLTIVLAVSTPCATEDSQNCRWDAEAHGNGLGSSFITVGPEGDQTFYYETGAETATEFRLN